MSDHADRWVQEQPSATAGTAIYPFSPKLAKKFTVFSRFDEEVVLYKQVGNTILLPRAVCPIGVEDRRTLGLPYKFQGSVKPRNPEQARIIHDASKLLLDGESFVLEAFTGFGKTVVACALIQAVGRKTLVIVPKEDLMHAWRESIVRFLGLDQSQIGRIQQDVYDVDGKSVVLAMLHSLSIPGRYPDSVRDLFGFVLWDEVHMVPAPTFMETAGMFRAKLRLGLSATPYRKDGKDIVIHAHIGPVRVRSTEITLSPKVAVYPTPWYCPRWKIDGKLVKAPHSPGKCGHIVSDMAKSMARNRLVVSKIIQAYKAKRNTVIFSDRREQLELLRSMAHTAGARVEDTAFYVSGMTKKQRDSAAGKPLIFATYGMMAVGTNIPWLDCAILATPRSAVKQVVGRILREYPDKPQPVVIDFVDKDSHVFAGYAEARYRFYRSIKADVTFPGAA